MSRLHWLFHTDCREKTGTENPLCWTPSNTRHTEILFFNKSSESKGSRTLSSYTRGLLDATAGTYMRPAERVPNVYSHIVLEFWDDVAEKPFLLGDGDRDRRFQ